MKSLIVLSTLTAFAFAFNNTPPIPERHPGWSIGKNRLLIDIELFTDLTCDGCAMLHPEFERFLDMKFLGYPVRTQIGVNYAFLALPYHHASWIPHRLLPFVIDQCLGTDNCQFDAYITYAYEQRDVFLNNTYKTYDQLTDTWIS
jgi:hypothetical protein